MHLVLVSPVFKAMLSGQFKEAGMLRELGFVEIPLLDDDPKALAILLDIIHGHIDRVPLQVELKTLTELAIEIDYYQFQEVSSIFSAFWTNSMQTEFGSYTRELLENLCITWVFRDAYRFARATKLLVLRTKSNISECDVSGLPLPASVIGKLLHFSTVDVVRC